MAYKVVVRINGTPGDYAQKGLLSPSNLYNSFVRNISEEFLATQTFILTSFKTI